jgi:hypothetical protein
VEFLPGRFWSLGLALFAVLGVLSPWRIASRSTRLMAGAMICGSVAAVVGAGVDPLWEGVVAGAGVVAFVVAAQVLGDALVRGGYDRLIRGLWGQRRFTTAALALGGGYVLSWVFMFTSMPVMYSALHSHAEEARERRSVAGKDLGILLARAYGAAAIATPMGATVLVALAVTDVPLGRFLVAAIPLSLAMVPLALVGMRRRLRELDERSPRPREPQFGRVAYALLWTMSLALAAMILTVSALELPPLAGVAAGVIAIASVWGRLGRRLIPIAPGSELRRSDQLARYGRRLADGSLLILAGSVVGTSLARSPLMDEVARDLASAGSTGLGVVVTVVVVVALRVVGMPPPAIVLVAGPVLVRAVALEPVAMAVLLVAASIFGFLLAPASLTSAMVSSLTGWAPADVSLARQAPFVLLGGLVACAYVLLIS